LGSKKEIKIPKRLNRSQIRFKPTNLKKVDFLLEIEETSFFVVSNFRMYLLYNFNKIIPIAKATITTND
jgi:hypothetical protein